MMPSLAVMELLIVLVNPSSEIDSQAKMMNDDEEEVRKSQREDQEEDEARPKQGGGDQGSRFDGAVNCRSPSIDNVKSQQMFGSIISLHLMVSIRGLNYFSIPWNMLLQNVVVNQLLRHLSASLNFTTMTGDN